MACCSYARPSTSAVAISPFPQRRHYRDAISYRSSNRPLGLKRPRYEGKQDRFLRLLQQETPLPDNGSFPELQAFGRQEVRRGFHDHGRELVEDKIQFRYVPDPAPFWKKLNIFDGRPRSAHVEALVRTFWDMWSTQRSRYTVGFIFGRQNREKHGLKPHPVVDPASWPWYFGRPWWRLAAYLMRRPPPEDPMMWKHKAWEEDMLRAVSQQYLDYCRALTSGSEIDIRRFQEQHDPSPPVVASLRQAVAERTRGPSSTLQMHILPPSCVSVRYTETRSDPIDIESDVGIEAQVLVRFPSRQIVETVDAAIPPPIRFGEHAIPTRSRASASERRAMAASAQQSTIVTATPVQYFAFARDLGSTKKPLDNTWRMNAELYPQDPLISETDRLALVPRPPDFYRTWIEGKQEDAEGTEGKKEEEKEKEERETKRLPRLGSAPTAV